MFIFFFIENGVATTLELAAVPFFSFSDLATFVCSEMYTKIFVLDGKCFDYGNFPLQCIL